jgi:hypothetical protein
MKPPQDKTTGIRLWRYNDLQVGGFGKIRLVFVIVIKAKNLCLLRGSSWAKERHGCLVGICQQQLSLHPTACSMPRHP